MNDRIELEKELVAYAEHLDMADEIIIKLLLDIRDLLIDSTSKVENIDRGIARIGNRIK